MNIKRKILIIFSGLFLLLLICFGYMYYTGNFQLLMGIKYEQGQGVVKDYKQAFKWYKTAAEKGNIWGEYRLGTMYYEGFGTPQNYDEGMKWYKIAAEKGYISAQLALAHIYYFDKNHIEKENYYIGKPPVLKHLWDEDIRPVRYKYIEDLSNDINYREAAKWYQKAAEQGDATGQRNLGEMYENGEGVIKDYILAHVWYNLSSANTSENYLSESAREDRERVERKMTKEQIGKAQNIAREWKPKKN